MMSCRMVTWNTIYKLAVLLLLIAFVVVESAPRARPRFIAIPLEDVHLVEVEDLPNSRSPTHTLRVPRDTESKFQNDADAARYERQAGGDGHHQYVDFGAHTGHHGSFGWYADFPVQDPGH